MPPKMPKMGQLPPLSLFCFLISLLLVLVHTFPSPRPNELNSGGEQFGGGERRRKVAIVDGKGRQTAEDHQHNGTAGGGGPYQVVRIQPETGEQLRLLEMLELNGAEDMELNFWTSPVRAGSSVDVMLPARKVPILRRYLHRHRMHTDVIIEDVERLIIQRERKAFRKEDDDQLMGNSRFLLADDPTPIRGIQQQQQQGEPKFDFHHYNSYAQMVAWMRAVARKHSKLVQFISIGKTHEGRGIDGLEIGSRGFRKRAFWIDGGIHAREWAAPHTALYFIHLLTSRYGKDDEITRLVDEITWIIVPLINPDGYEYTRSSTHPNVRLWRKNRSPTHCVRDQWGRNRCCRGVDLNRNFDFHFKETGSSDDPCSEIYQGIFAFSEPESRSVREAVLSNRYRGRIDGFITMHTYSQIWIHPYGHKRDSYPGDVQDLYTVGKQATTALSKLYGTKYVLGSGADTLYPASGGSEDWAKESANIKFVYLLELRPDEKNWDGFILDEGQLIPTASETWAGVKVVADAIIQRARARTKLSAATSRHRAVAAGIRQYRPAEAAAGEYGDGGEGRRIVPLSSPTKEWNQLLLLKAGDGDGGDRQREGGEEQRSRRRNCFDRRRTCRRWVLESESICQAVSEFMGEQCALSCGFC